MQPEHIVEALLAGRTARVPDDHPLAGRCVAGGERKYHSRSTAIQPFKFQGVRDAVHRIRDALLPPEGSRDFPEDTEQWWGRQVLKTQLERPKRPDGD